MAHAPTTDPAQAPSGTGPRVLLVEPLGRGGIADYTRELAVALAGAGAAVTVATARDHLYGACPGVQVRALIPWVRSTATLGALIRRARLGQAVNAVAFLAVLPHLAAMARRSDLVHVQGPYHPPLLVVLFGLLRALGVPVVHTPHNSFDRRRAYDGARRLLLATAGATVLHVRADVERLPPSARPRAAVIPHGEYGGLARRGGSADPDEVRRALGLSSDRVVVLLFGQLRHDKGIADLLEAAASVPDVDVLLAGEDIGGLAEVAPLLERPELAGRVLIREGFHAMPEVARFFAACDAAVLPYRIASQSGVLLLAYGFARPVVIYPIPSLLESVEDGETGWVAADTTIPALAETLRGLAAGGRDECRRRGAAGRRLADDRFSWDRVAARTLELYGTLAGDAAQSRSTSTSRPS